MISAHFDTEALTRVRFGISPMLELIGSVAVLRDPAANTLHLPWVEQVRLAAADIDTSALTAMTTSPGYHPDFINPPPSGPLVEFEDELAVMVATPPEQIRDEVRTAYPDVPVPEVLEPFLAAPERAIEDLAQTMRLYWQRCLAEQWPRIRALLEHDVLYRSRRIADGGVRSLFADLDPGVVWNDGVLGIECCDWDDTLKLDERGLLMVPSAFLWRKVTLVSAAPWQPTLVYPARGLGMLWDPDRFASPEALERLLGRTRAGLLMALESPRSTTELAGAFGVTPGAISQHLAVLHDAGLVQRRRVVRSVLYLRSAHGDELVSAAAPDEPSLREAGAERLTLA
jgi:DNA-binding transcriptional ArsR family regulator